MLPLYMTRLVYCGLRMGKVQPTMIPGLHSYLDGKLAVSGDVSKATIGINAELLSGLNSAEIVARLGVSSSGSASKSMSFIVVFDGPGRTTPSKLDDGLQRRRTLRAVRDARIPVIVAPALAAAQLAYLYKHRFISHVAGADEALLWADAPLVLNLFTAVLNPQQAVILHRKSLLASLRIAEPAFIEAMLGAGHNAVIEPHLPLCSDESPLDEVCRVAFQFGGPAPPQLPPVAPGAPNPVQGPNVSVLRAAMLAPPSQCSPEYIAQLQRALVYVQRQPVLDTDGQIHLFNMSQQPVPRDLTDILGRQLGPELYWYLNKGLAGPELLRGMIYGKFSDSYRVPAARGSSSDAIQSYARVEREVQPLRQQAYSLLTAPAHRYFQVKSVSHEFGDFVRISPILPTIEREEATDPAQVVAAAVRHARTVAKLGQTRIPMMPEELAKRALGSEVAPSPLLVNIATLALRELVEAVVCWFLATKKIPRENTEELVRAMPWA